MRPAVRIAIVVVGLAAATYGTASLTGGWLGTPPWRVRAAPIDPMDWLHRHCYRAEVPPFFPGWRRRGSGLWFVRPAGPADWVDKPCPFELAEIPLSEAETKASSQVESRPGSEWISGVVVAVGLMLVVVGVSSYRRRPSKAALLSSGQD